MQEKFQECGMGNHCQRIDIFSMSRFPRRFIPEKGTQGGNNDQIFQVKYSGKVHGDRGTVLLPSSLT